MSMIIFLTELLWPVALGDNRYLNVTDSTSHLMREAAQSATARSVSHWLETQASVHHRDLLNRAAEYGAYADMLVGDDADPYVFGVIAGLSSDNVATLLNEIETCVKHVAKDAPDNGIQESFLSKVPSMRGVIATTGAISEN